MKLRYMIIGAGGVGGPVGAYLSKSGADTTLIARGKHLAVMQEHGLTLVSGENERESIPVKAIDMDGFLAAREQGAPAPDVIFVCVKGYSLADTVPFIRKAAGRDTVVIPVLNIYGTGRTLQAELPELLVTDGCIYISANRIAPGVIQKHGAICRIVYGLPSHKTDHPVLQQVETDLKNAGIDSVYSPYVERDTLLKFAYVSPNAACGQYYHAKAAEMQHPGEVRDSFVCLIKEVVAIADKMGIPLESRPGELVERNLRILDALAPTASTSMQRDMEAGKQSEVEFDPECPLFKGCKAPLLVARYHSLAADPATMPPELRVTARTADGEVMAVQHTQYPIYGVQFHPESILTPQGRSILKNFMEG